MLLVIQSTTVHQTQSVRPSVLLHSQETFECSRTELLRNKNAREKRFVAPCNGLSHDLHHSRLQEAVTFRISVDELADDWRLLELNAFTITTSALVEAQGADLKKFELFWYSV